jgi:hypothetical protein
MLKARQGKELKIRVKNEIGMLSKLAKSIAEKGINLLAISCWVEGKDAVMRLVADDMLRTKDLLVQEGYRIREGDVVIVDAEHKPGILKHLTDRLVRDGIDIKHLYASATLDQAICLVVLSTSNNERAIVELNV